MPMKSYPRSVAHNASRFYQAAMFLSLLTVLAMRRFNARRACERHAPAAHDRFLYAEYRCGSGFVVVQ